MNFARFSVTRPVAVTMRIAALVLFGAVCYTKLPVDLLPEITIPTINVTTTWPNVAPQEIETQVTRPIERAMASVPGLYQISSSSEEGNSNVRVQFQWGVDIDQAAVDVLQQVQRARRDLPTDPTLQNPVVSKWDPNSMPIRTYGVSGVSDPIKLRTLLNNQVAPIIESANGVGGVTVSGGLERAILVEIDPERLQAHNLSLNDVSRRLVEENLNLPAGIGRQGNTEYIIRSLGLFNSPEEIGKTPVGSFNGQLVSLAQVATIRDANQERRVFSRLNGENAVSISVSKQSGANTIAAGEAVEQKLAQVKKAFPQLKFNMASDQSQFIRASIHSVQEHALIGGALAILILLFFLRNFRSTMVVALSIPISVISTFSLIYMCGFTLNTMSLSGLALATGLIVDDAVVVLENIFRHIERDKKSPFEAAIDGTREITSAVIASTFTVIVVFLPMLLIQGQTGQMFMQFALVVVFSLLVSLLDATTVVPMLASRIIRDGDHMEESEDDDPTHHRGIVGRVFHRAGIMFNALDHSYRQGLEWALPRRTYVVGGAVMLTMASLLLVPYIGMETMPESDSGDFRVSVRMPVGTALETTNKVMQRVEKILMDNPNVETVLATAGTGNAWRTNSLSSNQGTVTVKLKRERDKSMQEVTNELRRPLNQIAGARIFIRPFDIVNNILSGGAQNLEVNIFGDDLSTLAKLGQQAMTQMRDIPGLENLDVSWQEATPELQWKIDREKALQMGVSFQDVASTLNTATRGTISSYYQEGGFQYPILVQLPEDRRKTVPDLMNVRIRTSAAGGEAKDIALSQVADVSYGVGPSEIQRLDRQRYIGVNGRPEGRSPSEVQAEVEAALSKVEFPSGYYWAWGTSQQRRAEEFAGLGLAVILAVALIYMLLASQFESFTHPLTVLTSVPLSIVGVVLIFFLTGRSFGLTAFVGVLLLIGIVVKNGILLVDYTNHLRREEGYERTEAILRASPTRLRPILMTTGATIGGMLFIALGIGEGSEMQAPMATAVIGGLITSTLLTLFVVPTVYTFFDDLSLYFERRKGATFTPISTPELEAAMSGSTNGHGGNGHAGNGHGAPSDGHAEPVGEPTAPAERAPVAVHANGDGYGNGNGNGGNGNGHGNVHAQANRNGRANGSNGHVNGHTSGNGHSNGHGNGTSNGSGKAKETPEPISGGTGDPVSPPDR